MYKARCVTTFQQTQHYSFLTMGSECSECCSKHDIDSQKEGNCETITPKYPQTSTSSNKTADQTINTPHRIDTLSTKSKRKEKYEYFKHYPGDLIQISNSDCIVKALPKNELELESLNNDNINTDDTQSIDDTYMTLDIDIKTDSRGTKSQLNHINLIQVGWIMNIQDYHVLVVSK